MESLIVEKKAGLITTRSIPFSSRVWQSFKGTLWLYPLLIICALVANNVRGGMLISAALFLLYYLENRRWQKNQLVKVKADEGILSIDYLVENELHSLSGEASAFTVSTGKVWYKTRSTLDYLSITHKDGACIRQFPIADMDKEAFDHIISIISGAKIHHFDTGNN